MSRSQLGQDLTVLKFYNNKRDGYFIEIGASDGIKLSNTYLLESQYGWKGICVEPIPNNYNKLVLLFYSYNNFYINSIYYFYEMGICKQ